MSRVALVTGGAQRVGAQIVRTLHDAGYGIALHYRSSHAAAEQLAVELNAVRADSVTLHQADLLAYAELPHLIDDVLAHHGRLDLLVNNASLFYPTTVGLVSEEIWEELLGSNLKAPFLLAQAAAPYLKTVRGCIVNIVDVHAERPMKGYPVYSMAKAGNAMMVKALAKELAPEVRVNGVAPGAILWPTGELGAEMDEEQKAAILARVALGRSGSPEDIARMVRFLASEEAGYVTGQIIAVDGGRSLNL